MTAKNIAAICLFCALQCLELAAEREYTVVETDTGTFKGYIRRFKALGQDLTVRRFLGVPYAEPPLGDRRFAKPVRKGKLAEPYDATELPPSCKQQVISLGGQRKPGRFANPKVSEDCLYLNIFTPKGAGKTGGLLPVMIYIHGGGFVFGSQKLYPQDVLSVYGNVVAVTIAYRLSIWGFLSTGDQELPGNYGLWDQHMAIQWVHDNIAKFGGDSSSVTIYGSSAGGSSVVYQGMYPGNQGLVHRAISQSGSITCRFALCPDPLSSTARLGKLVGCHDGSTKELAACLKTKSSDELFGVITNKANNFSALPWDFIPVVDNDFIPETPAKLFHGSSKAAIEYRKAISNIELMVGLTSADGFILYTPLTDVFDADAFDIDLEKFEKELVPLVLRIYFGNDVPDVLTDVIIGEYTNWDDPDNKRKVHDSYVKLGGDFLFAFHATETAKVHAKEAGKNTYFFMYDAFPSQHIFPVPKWADKPTHVDEMTTLLGYDNEDGYTSWTTPYTDDPPADWEIELSKAHIKMWTNFARTGNPNGPTDVRYFTKTAWPVFDTKSEYYLEIDRDMSADSVGQRLLAREENLWLNVLPKIIKAVKGGRYSSLKSKDQDYCEKDEDCKP